MAVTFIHVTRVSVLTAKPEREQLLLLVAIHMIFPRVRSSLVALNHPTLVWSTVRNSQRGTSAIK